MIKELYSKKRNYIVYQEDDNGFAEPAIAVIEYEGDIIGIEQEGIEVNINRQSIGELIKVLKIMQKEETT